MRSRFPSLSALLITTSIGMAQTYTELPAGFTTLVTEYYDPYLAPASSYIPVHIQYAYSVNDIPVPVANITELAWHRNNYWGNGMPAGSITTTVTLGMSPNAPSAMSTTFASNLVNLTSVVYSGTTNWPLVNKGTGPAPYTHNILLNTPYLYIAGSNLSFVVDHVMTATTYANSTYTIDAAAPDGGKRMENGGAQSTCKFSNGNYNNSLSYTTGGLSNSGGTWYVQYGSVVPNAVGATSLSAYGLDYQGPFTLPIDLAAINAPGCKWTIGLESGIAIGVTANASGQARVPNVTIPPGLGGFAFYEQAIFIDPPANGVGLVVTWPSKWYVGTGKGPVANTLYKTQDTASSPTGNLRPGYGTHLRITR